MEEEGRKGSEINQARQAAEGKFTLLCGRQWLGWLNGAEGSSAEMEWKQLRPAEWPAGIIDGMSLRMESIMKAIAAQQRR